MTAPTESPTEDPKQKLAELLDELFSANFAYSQGEYVSPLNADHSETQNIHRRKEKELYATLAKVNEAIEKDGGISKETYEEHKYEINSPARDLSNQRWWGSGMIGLCEQEDREGKKATPEQIARFPRDRFFSEDKYEHTNIFDKDGKTSGTEGTLFQTEYDKQGNLETYRIFHQGHRNALGIKTVNIPELITKIKQFVAEFIDKTPGQRLGFTLDRETYLRKIEEFNAKYGKFVTIEIFEDSIIAKFSKNPQQVAKKLVSLGQQNGIKLNSRMGPMAYTVSQTEPPYAYTDLFLPDQLQGKNDKFDPEKHKNTPAVMFPYLQPIFTNKLIALYASQQN